MKRFLLPVLMILLCAAPLHASSEKGFVTGEDWNRRLSVREKYLSLVPPALLFADYDVHLKLSLPQYIFLIDRIMERNPRLADEEVSNIFASTIYLFEPANRAALTRMEMDFLKGDFLPPALSPQLTVEETLEEVPN